MDPDPVQRIALAVTPAVMVSACGLIALGLDNQAGRMTARIREMVREWRSLSHDEARRATLRKEVAILARRHGILARAVTLNYAALLSFVATSLLYLTQGIAPVPRGLPLTVFAFGVALLAAVAVFALASVRLSRAAIGIEIVESM